MTLMTFFQNIRFFKGRRDALTSEEIQNQFWDAVCAGDVCQARAWVARGADVNAFDVDGHSALYMASLHGRMDMCQWLDYMREREAKRLETRHAQAA